MNKFMEMNEQELMETNGGLVWAIAGGILVGIIVDEVVERTTGSDIATHVGNGLEAAGKWISGK